MILLKKMRAAKLIRRCCRPLFEKGHEADQLLHDQEVIVVAHRCLAVLYRVSRFSGGSAPSAGTGC
jgi:hypothetical protein